MISSLKFKELDSSAHRMALAVAAALCGLITIPALRVTPPPVLAPVAEPSPVWRKRSLLAIGAVLFLGIVMGGAWWGLGLLSSTNPTPPTATDAVVLTLVRLNTYLDAYCHVFACNRNVSAGGDCLCCLGNSQRAGRRVSGAWLSACGQPGAANRPQRRRRLTAN